MRELALNFAYDDLLILFFLHFLLTSAARCIIFLPQISSELLLLLTPAIVEFLILISPFGRASTLLFIAFSRLHPHHTSPSL